MNRLKLACLFLLLSVFIMSIAACGNKNGEQSLYKMYYLNKEETKLVEEGYQPTSRDTYGIVEEFIARLNENPTDVNLRKIKQDNVEVLSWTLEERHVYITFSSSYYELSSISEVLLRAGVVLMLDQIDGVDYISVYVDEQPLVNADGMLVGIMTSDDFVEKTGEQINSYDRNEFTLYYANANGDKLVETSMDLVYSANMSIEKVVIEQLIKGPSGEGIYPTLSSSTKIISVNNRDGICYVNFDDEFLNLPDGVTEPIPIYSVVNTLLELSNVSKVQIAVNGETNMVYKEAISLDTLFERNLDIVDK